jgi:hypothetical protein
MNKIKIKTKSLKAMATDRLFPYINKSGKGYGPNNEPRVATVIVAIVAFAFLMIGIKNRITI